MLAMKVVLHQISHHQKKYLDEIMLSISESGYKPEEEISLALDAAATEFYVNEEYVIEGNIS